MHFSITTIFSIFMEITMRIDKMNKNEDMPATCQSGAAQSLAGRLIHLR